MEATRRLIHEKYPSLEFVCEEQTRFSEQITPAQRLDIAMQIRLCEENTWRRVGSLIGLSNDLIDFSDKLKEHKGCPAMNMLDFYMNQGADCLTTFVHALAALSLHRVLKKLADIFMWPTRMFLTLLYSAPGCNGAKLYNKCIRSLVDCLYRNHFRSIMDVPKLQLVPGGCSWRQWDIHQFSQCDYVLVCITPAYLEAVRGTDELSDEDELTDNLHSTCYIYQLMEHEVQSLGGANVRFIPVILQDAEEIGVSQLPWFLQSKDVGLYVWPRDYEDLLRRLVNPSDQRISGSFNKVAI